MTTRPDLTEPDFPPCRLNQCDGSGWYELDSLRFCPSDVRCNQWSFEGGCKGHKAESRCLCGNSYPVVSVFRNGKPLPERTA